MGRLQIAQLPSRATHAAQHSWQPPWPQGDTHHAVSGDRSSRQMGHWGSEASTSAPSFAAAAFASSRTR